MVSIDKHVISQYHLVLIAGNAFGETQEGIVIDIHDSDYESLPVDTLNLDVISGMQKDSKGSFYVIGTKWLDDGYYRGIPVVAKYDQTKALQWVREFDIEDNVSILEQVTSVGLGVRKNRLYIAGAIQGRLKDVDSLYDDTENLFAVALESNGTVLWKRQFGAPQKPFYKNKLNQH